MNRLTSPSAHTSRGKALVPVRRCSGTSLLFTIASVAKKARRGTNNYMRYG
jgi:hypothetical protein